MLTLLQTAMQLEPTKSVLFQQLLHLNMLKLTLLRRLGNAKQRTMLPSSHHTTGHYSHLDREGVCVFDEEGLYSEALAEHRRLVNSSQGYSLICVEAPDKVGPGRGERRGEEGRGDGRGGERSGGERSGGKGRGGKERQREGRGGKMREKEEDTKEKKG